MVGTNLNGSTTVVGSKRLQMGQKTGIRSVFVPPKQPTSVSKTSIGRALRCSRDKSGRNKCLVLGELELVRAYTDTITLAGREQSN